MSTNTHFALDPEVALSFKNTYAHGLVHAHVNAATMDQAIAVASAKMKREGWDCRYEHILEDAGEWRYIVTFQLSLVSWGDVIAHEEDQKGTNLEEWEIEALPQEVPE